MSFQLNRNKLHTGLRKLELGHNTNVDSFG